MPDHIRARVPLLGSMAGFGAVVLVVLGAVGYRWHVTFMTRP